MKIAIIGLNNLERSIFSKRILEIFDVDNGNYRKIKSEQNNYFEDSFKLKDGRDFKIINLPCYFSCSPYQKNVKEFFNVVKEKNDLIISESDHVVLVTSDNHFSSKENMLIIKDLQKNKKKYSLIFINRNDYKEEFDFKFSLKGTNCYDIPLFPSLKSKYFIREFLKKEFFIHSFEIEKENEIEKEKEKSLVNISIIGPPNSGKSSVLNSIIGYERSLVSEFEGTTKEEISSFFKYKKWNFNIFDTEGVFKKNGVFTISSIKTSDLVLLIIDITKPITKNILQITNFSQKYSISLLVVMNKLDLTDNIVSRNRVNDIRYRLKSFSFVPIVMVSAKKRTNFGDLFIKLEDMINQSKICLSKKEIVNCIKIFMEKCPPPTIKGKRLKIYYGIHEGGFIHKLIFFVNDTKCIHFSYQRYIINSFRKYFKIDNLPLKVFFKKS